MSPPSRRRGLKSLYELIEHHSEVASFAEAWIEISTVIKLSAAGWGRLLRGGVD